MNDVLNPFQIPPHPTQIQTSLLSSGALFSKFDPSGRWIATAKSNGTVVIWDLGTKAPIRVLDGHVRSVTCVDWSRYGRYLLTGSKDWNVIVWDLAKRQCPGGGGGEETESIPPLQRMKTVRFDSGVMGSSFHPRNSKIILTLLSTGELFLTDLRKREEYRGRVELYDTLHEREVQAEDGETAPENTVEGGGGESGHHQQGNGNNGEKDHLHHHHRRSTRQRSPITVARFDISGKYVFAGTANGMLLVFNTRTKYMVGRHRIVGAGTMKSLDFTKNGRRLVTNSSDRILRQFTIPNYPSSPTSNNSSGSSTTTTGLIVNEQELEPTHRFNDPINKTAWHVMAYSPDGEWLAGGSADPATHKIYIWDLSNDGQFSTALDGGREPLAHIHWHPVKSLIASTTSRGNILIWHCPKPERWGAFAGGFEEVDENIEYEEKEDEFDIEDEEVMQERKMKAEEIEVDVDGIDSSIDTSSSSPNIIQKQSLNSTASSTVSTTSSSSPKKPSSTINSADNNKTNVEKSNSSSTAGKDGGEGRGGKIVVDTDIVWADEDPDEDEKGWKMHMSKSAAELAEELGL